MLTRGEGIKVLIIGDDRKTRGVIEYILLKKKYLIEKVNNGAEALLKIAKDKPDIILVDEITPQIDGDEVCRRIKSNSETRDIPIILLTVMPIQGIKEREIYIDDYIEKPFSIDELYEKIDKTINRGSSHFS